MHIYLSIYPSIHLSIYLSIYLSMYMYRIAQSGPIYTLNGPQTRYYLYTWRPRDLFWAAAPHALHRIASSRLQSRSYGPVMRNEPITCPHKPSTQQKPISCKGGAVEAVEARQLEHSRPRPQTPERRKTNINHPPSMFQLFGVFIYIYISTSISISSIFHLFGVYSLRPCKAPIPQKHTWAAGSGPQASKTT